MAEVAEGAYEVNPRGQLRAYYGGRSVPVEGSGTTQRESTLSGLAWFRTTPRETAPDSTPALRTGRPAPCIELTELTAAPEAALAAASAPPLEGDCEENSGERDLSQSPRTIRRRKLKISAMASLFLVAVAVALGMRAGLAPKSTFGNDKTDMEAKPVTLGVSLATEAEGSSDPRGSDAPVGDPDILYYSNDAANVDTDYPSAPGGSDAPVDDPDILYYSNDAADELGIEGSGKIGCNELPQPRGPLFQIRRDLRRGREVGRPAEAPLSRRILDCEELLAANMESSSDSDKSSKTGKTKQTTELSSTAASKTSKPSTDYYYYASNGSDDSPASMSLSTNEDETSVLHGAPPASEPTTSDPPTSFLPTSYVPTSYVPTSYAPTNEPDPDAPCSGRGTLDPSGRQCTCNQGYFRTVLAGVPDCLKVVPVGLGCDGQRVPSCKEQKFSPEPKCCPRPPRGDLLLCIPTTGPDAGVCG